jgi:hypothetical protein
VQSVCTRRDTAYTQLRQQLFCISILLNALTQASSIHQHSNPPSFQLEPVQQFWGHPSGNFPTELSVHAGEQSAHTTSNTAVAQHSGAVITTPRSNSYASANGHAVLNSKPPTPLAKTGAAEQVNYSTLATN